MSTANNDEQSTMYEEPCFIQAFGIREKEFCETLDKVRDKVGTKSVLEPFPDGVSLESEANLSRCIWPCQSSKKDATGTGGEKLSLFFC